MAFDSDLGVESGPCVFCHGRGVVPRAEGETARGPQLHSYFVFCHCQIGADLEAGRINTLHPKGGAKAPLDMFPNTVHGFEDWFNYKDGDEI